MIITVFIGLCNCFNGYYGESCGTIDPRAVYERWNNALN